MNPLTHQAGNITDARTEPEAMRFAGFVTELRRRGRAPKTIGSYRSDWIGFTDWFLENEGRAFTIAGLTAGAAEQYRDHLVSKGMRPATVNRKLVFIKRYAQWALDRMAIDAVTYNDLRGVAPVAQGPRKPRSLSDIELRRFLREVERRASRRDQAIVYCLLETGLRVSELVALSIDQLTLGARRGCIVVEDVRHHNTRYRRLSLGGMARRKLRSYVIERGQEPGALFIGERGALTANAVQRLLRKYCAFAKVKVSPSILRHTFANSFLESEGDVVELADLLGHESLETTRLYLTAKIETVAPTMGNKPVRPHVVFQEDAE
jgi:site-specific recombinase XerD